MVPVDHSFVYICMYRALVTSGHVEQAQISPFWRQHWAPRVRKPRQTVVRYKNLLTQNTNQYYIIPYLPKARNNHLGIVPKLSIWLATGYLVPSSTNQRVADITGYPEMETYEREWASGTERWDPCGDSFPSWQLTIICNYTHLQQIARNIA